MNRKQQNEKIIFGLKVRLLRQQKQLSYADFSKLTGMSVSYLNEIEKGKKFPKEDKVKIIAQALDIAPATLTAPVLPMTLAPLEDLLNSNFLNELPLNLFGIDLSKVVEMIARAPSRVGAFISTLVELARNYALAEENFYFGALRFYLEINNNYFDEIENAVDTFVNTYNIPADTAVEVPVLQRLLEIKFGYEIVEGGLNQYKELSGLRAVSIPQKRKLLLNSNLTDGQKAFQFGKELGFCYLNLEDRAYTSSLLRVKNFDQVLNHFKAGYFSAAMLINRQSIIEDVAQFFENPQWDSAWLLRLMEKYRASPEMLFQRMTNVLPKYFDLENIFILRFIHTPSVNKLKIDKELHLNRKHRPHANSLQEHYCRRWLSFTLLKKLQASTDHSGRGEILADAQRSYYFGTEDEYLCLTIARSGYPAKDKNVSVTLGILIEKDLQKKIKFVEDNRIASRVVNTTCERCAVKHCQERAVPPSVVMEKERYKSISSRLKQLAGED